MPTQLAKNIDHGKTSLLDSLRGSCIVDKEAGKITQHVSATEIPIATIKKHCGAALDKLGIKITIPGLLFIDTPGHAAFNTLRKRGGALADIAILIIDIMEGIMPQTEECISILKHNKTPFVIALTKADLLPGWESKTCGPILDSLKNQKPEVQEEVEKRLYKLVGQLSEKEIQSERFDRITDFTKNVAIVPMSSKTGEGLPDLLMVLTGLSQKYLEDKLKTKVTGRGKGTVLEVKESRGFGPTLDLILYDGVLKKGDSIAIMAKDGPIETKVKVLLKPKPLVESRLGKEFDKVDQVTAAAGVKVSAPNLDNVLPGSPLKVIEGDKQSTFNEVQSEFESVKIETDQMGAILKADTIGSLEALIAFLKDHEIPIRLADIGPVSKTDIAEASIVKQTDLFLGVVFAFNVPTLPDAEHKSKETEVKIFAEPVIYHLVDSYKEWKEKEMDRQKLAHLEDLPKPAVMKYLPGYTFRQSHPAVFGVEVLEGEIKQKTSLIKEDGHSAGTLSEIQSEGKTIKSAKKGQQVALSVEGITLGRQLNEGDILITDLTEVQIERLKNLKGLLTESEIEALKKVILVKQQGV